MSHFLNVEAFLPVPVPAGAFASEHGWAADLPAAPGGSADRAEGGPGLFRCMLVCSAVSLSGYALAAWLIF